MENSRAVKKVFDTRPDGTRKVGGPKLRWEDSVIQDIRQGPGSGELDECSYEQTGLAEASEQDHGPHRTIEQMMMAMMMMMMMMMMITEFLRCLERFFCGQFHDTASVQTI
jgi:hypothetical protein